MASYQIPFNKPCLQGKEIDYILEAISGGHASGDGPFTHRCSSMLQEILEVPRVMLTTSCTDALEMAALLIRIRPGDEVIVPSFTFVSTANAFALRGARIVFADIRPDTLNIDETQLENHVTSRTRAVVPVHYAGVACEMDAIVEIARHHGLAIVEDNAHGLFAKYKSRNLGTFGDLATLSFHETKNITCGEGGALLINTPRYLERAEVVREKGTDRSRFFRGEVDKYTWVDLGSSYLPSDILAAFLLAQLEQRDRIQAKRRRIWELYYRKLEAWAKSESVQLPTVADHCEQSYHMFYMLMPTATQRDAFIAYLKARGILTVFHYLPLHLSAMGQRYGGKKGDCPVTEDISARLVRLPFFNDLTVAEQLFIISEITKFSGAERSPSGYKDL